MHNNMVNNIKKELKEKIAEVKLTAELQQAQLHVDSINANTTRGRVIAVGNAFGGMTEVSIRGEANHNLWVLMQPAEVIELIHTLSSNIGCHINIKPRKDFASWRGWKANGKEEELAWGTAWQGGGYAPHPTLEDEAKIGINFNPIPPGNIDDPITGETNETLAITKTVNKRKSKRTTTPT